MNTLITMYIHTCVLTKCGYDIQSSFLHVLELKLQSVICVMEFTIHVYKYSNVLLMNDYKCLYSCVVWVT